MNENEITAKVLAKVGCYKIPFKCEDNTYDDITILMFKLKVGKKQYVIGRFATMSFRRELIEKYVDNPMRTGGSLVWKMPDELIQYIPGSENWKISDGDSEKSSVMYLTKMSYKYTCDNFYALPPDWFSKLLNENLKFFRSKHTFKQVAPQFPATGYFVPDVNETFNFTSAQEIIESAQKYVNKFFFKEIK